MTGFGGYSDEKLLSLLVDPDEPDADRINDPILDELARRKARREQMLVAPGEVYLKKTFQKS